MFITYKTFNDPELAAQLINHFTENGIEYEIEDDSKIFAPSFFPNEATRVITVKIRQEDFEKANSLLSNLSIQELNSISKDYYLFSMTDDELLEIIRKPDEWTILDFELAKKLLKERGREIIPQELEQTKETRISELSKPDKSLTTYIYVGWFFILAGSIFWIIVPRPMYLGITVVGIMIGAGLFQSKKTLPDGKQVYRYNDNDRKQGRLIFIIGIIALLVSAVLGLKINS
jgi:hypothetical protein